MPNIDGNTSIIREEEKNVISQFSTETVIPGIRTISTRTPIFSQFEVTSRCNQRCVFCYNVWKGNVERTKDVTPSQRFQILDLLIDLEVLGLIFSGGEPLLVEELSDLITKAIEAGIDPTLITNGILLTEQRCHHLKRAGLSGMQISLHSYNHEKHDNITGVKGSFEKTVNGIRTAVDVFGDDAVSVNMVVTSKTFQDVFLCAECVHSLGCSNFSISSYSYTGNGKHAAQFPPNKMQFSIAFKQLLKVRSFLDISTLVSGSFPLCALGSPVDSDVLDNIGNVCDAGITQIVVAPNGDVRPCVSYEYCIGNILTDDIANVWMKDSFLRRLRRLENIPFRCRSCRFVLKCCGGCRASALAQFGRIDAHHPLLGEYDEIHCFS